MLEAIYFVSTGRSFRTNKLFELVQWEHESFSVSCEVELREVSHRIDAEVGVGHKRYVLDGKPCRGSAIFGNFKAVIFASEDLDVVRQEPSVRRRFFDLFFSQVDGDYRRHLADYQGVVKNRNALLAGESFSQLDAWDELLVREGSWLIWRRKNLLQEFEQTAALGHKMLTETNEDLGLYYKSSCDGQTKEEIAGALGGKLAQHRQHERILKTTLVGPHRDDIEIAVQGKPVRHFGSEGQKRSVMLSLRIAQWQFLAKIAGELPMILLDDVMGELDRQRQKAFLGQVMQSGAQTFIALTQASDFLRRASGGIVHVRQGALMHEAAGTRA